MRAMNDLRIPIRVRLTLWYVLLMGITFTALSVYLLLRFENNLRNSMDRSLQITAVKTIAALDEEDYKETGKLTFDHINPQWEPSDFAMRLVSNQGETWDSYGALQSGPEWGAPIVGFSTLTGSGEMPDWRIFRQPVLDSTGQVIGWLEAAQSLETLDKTLDDLTSQLLFGIPLMLLFAGAGGYFLANRALSPVEQITDTAQGIHLQDLSKRIHYRGAMDEVGRLAQTFDRMLARLQDSFERERRFTSDAAHELRTPLTVLKGQIEVALNRVRSPAEYENKLRELLAQVERLIRLSNALLFLSRSDQNRVDLKPADVDLTGLLGVLLEQFQPLADEKSLRISAQVADGLSVRGDHDLLIRLFMNLLENAVRYTPADGEVQVSAGKEAGGVRVEVYNSGAGISSEHLPHLFERFYRADKARSSQSGGSGLGLAIAHEIVRLHGGEITAHSEPGRGAAFTIFLPVRENSQPHVQRLSPRHGQ
ncbi:MAG: two-component sensor histidine kinase [Chloroflexi bacterium]|nr:two-component sensor histidine kinase [Chloroflexota bacterium]MDL1942118.1 heavy metal sensor histidine kinase [Chloroflexi bacterium CFX2]